MKITCMLGDDMGNALVSPLHRKTSQYQTITKILALKSFIMLLQQETLPMHPCNIQ